MYVLYCRCVHVYARLQRQKRLSHSLTLPSQWAQRANETRHSPARTQFKLLPKCAPLRRYWSRRWWAPTVSTAILRPHGELGTCRRSQPSSAEHLAPAMRVMCRKKYMRKGRGPIVCRPAEVVRAESTKRESRGLGYEGEGVCFDQDLHEWDLHGGWVVGLLLSHAHAHAHAHAHTYVRREPAALPVGSIPVLPSERSRGAWGICMWAPNISGQRRQAAVFGAQVPLLCGSRPVFPCPPPPAAHSVSVSVSMG